MDPQSRKASRNQLLILFGMREVDPKPVTGYTLAQNLKLGKNQVYTTLAQLQKVCPALIVLVKQESLGKQRKFYRLTDEGRELLKTAARPRGRAKPVLSRAQRSAFEVGLAVLRRLERGVATETELVQELKMPAAVICKRLADMCQGRYILLVRENGHFVITDEGREALYYIKGLIGGVEIL